MKRKKYLTLIERARENFALASEIAAEGENSR